MMCAESSTNAFFASSCVRCQVSPVTFCYWSWSNPSTMCCGDLLARIANFGNNVPSFLFTEEHFCNYWIWHFIFINWINKIFTRITYFKMHVLLIKLLKLFTLSCDFDLWTLQLLNLIGVGAESVKIKLQEDTELAYRPIQGKTIRSSRSHFCTYFQLMLDNIQMKSPIR